MVWSAGRPTRIKHTNTVNHCSCSVVPLCSLDAFHTSTIGKILRTPITPYTCHITRTLRTELSLVAHCLLTWRQIIATLWLVFDRHSLWFEYLDVVWFVDRDGKSENDLFSCVYRDCRHTFEQRGYGALGAINQMK